MADKHSGQSRTELILRAMQEEQAAVIAKGAEAAASHRALAELLRGRAAELDRTDA